MAFSCHRWRDGCSVSASRPRSRRTWLTAWGHGPIGAAVGAWPAVALVGSYELLMIVVRGTQQAADDVSLGTDQTGAGVPAVLQAQGVEEFAGDVMAGRPPSIRVIRARLHVGQPRAQLVRAYLATLAAG